MKSLILFSLLAISLLAFSGLSSALVPVQATTTRSQKVYVSGALSESTEVTRDLIDVIKSTAK